MASAERGGLDLGALWLAGRFLTRLPFPEPRDIRPKQLGQAVCWYPLIGLLLGVLITLGAQGLRWLDPAVGAAIILILWVWSTGALHLDGLADSADAWVGGLAGRERTLEILKDPHSGPVGVTALLLVLIAKWAGLHALIDDGAVGLLMMVPLLGRAQLPLLMLTTPYARARGMASEQVAQLPRRAAWVALLAAWLVVALSGGWVGPLLVAAGWAIFWLARRVMLARLAGFTGDTAGALVEITETLLLILLVVAQTLIA